MSRRHFECYLARGGAGCRFVGGVMSNGICPLPFVCSAYSVFFPSAFMHAFLKHASSLWVAFPCVSPSSCVYRQADCRTASLALYRVPSWPRPQASFSPANRVLLLLPEDVRQPFSHLSSSSLPSAYIDPLPSVDCCKVHFATARLLPPETESVSSSSSISLFHRRGSPRFFRYLLPSEALPVVASVDLRPYRSHRLAAGRRCRHPSAISAPSSAVWETPRKLDKAVAF